MDIIHKAGAVIVSKKGLLIVRASNKDFFISPGGKYEDGEDAETCLKREIKEELCCDVKSIRLFKSYNSHIAAGTDKSFHLDLFITEIEGDIRPASEIEEVEWMSRDDFYNKKYKLASSFYEFVPELIEAGVF